MELFAGLVMTIICALIGWAIGTEIRDALRRRGWKL
jgi:hypothetical protein